MAFIGLAHKAVGGEDTMRVSNHVFMAIFQRLDLVYLAQGRFTQSPGGDGRQIKGRNEQLEGHMNPNKLAINIRGSIISQGQWDKRGR